MSTSDDLKSALETEVERFRHMYPNSTVRFAEILGKRISHVAGPTDELLVGELRYPVNDRLVMFVTNGDGLTEEDLRRFAVQVAWVVS
ncbi:MAG: hypothetical protein QM473_02590 [Acidobacteriota bacterium]|nr:hypothetical protein [Acidobacteriota bacterium]